MPTEAQSAWINQIFEAQAVEKGDLVRRNKEDVHNLGGFENLHFAVLERGFHMIETGTQYVIICNKGALIIHC
jgi:hypothetical protein